MFAVIVIGVALLMAAAAAGGVISQRRLAAELQHARRQVAAERDLRIDYERALGLPFYNRQETDLALMARAARQDEIAESMLCMRLQRDLDHLSGQTHIPVTVDSVV
jgi:hypothetical protein